MLIIGLSEVEARRGQERPGEARRGQERSGEARRGQERLGDGQETAPSGV